MPIYEYKCRECGHEFEVMQKITDGPIRKCESCGKLRAKRLISQSSFILKGSGWYVTDYKGKNPNQEQHKQDKKDETSASDSSNKTEKTEKKESSKKEKPAKAEKAASA